MAKISKKEKAFQLFSEGKVSSSWWHRSESEQKRRSVIEQLRVVV
jgi:hypothetical protein